MSYPVSRTALDASLDGLDEATIRRIDFLPRPGPVLQASYVGETSRFRVGAGRVSLHIHAVPSGERKEIERALLDQGLALLRSWLDHVEEAGPTWRATGHSFLLRYADGALQASSD